MARYIAIKYCDDIRDEIGNKISLIGMYSSDLFVPGLPAMLPKLCIYAQLCGEVGQSFPADTVIKVFLDDDVVAESALPETDTPSLADGMFPVQTIRMIFAPFVVTKECKLRVRAYLDGDEIKGAALRIRLAPSDESTPESQGQTAQ